MPAYTSAAAASTVDAAQAEATGGGSGYSYAAATATATGSSSSGSTGSSGGSGAGTAISSLAGGSGVGGTTCTVTAAADASASIDSCSNILLQDVTVAASEGLTLTVPSGGALLFGGTMTVEYTPDTDYTPIVLSGSNVKVAGLAGAVIDGQGSQVCDNHQPHGFQGRCFVAGERQANVWIVLGWRGIQRWHRQARQVHLFGRCRHHDL